MTSLPFPFLALSSAAGILSTLFFYAAALGSPLGMLLSFFAAVPIFLVSLAAGRLGERFFSTTTFYRYGSAGGIVASLLGLCVLGLVAPLPVSLVFAFGTALPAWWLGDRLQPFLTPPLLQSRKIGFMFLGLVLIVVAQAVIGALSIAPDYAVLHASLKEAMDVLLKTRLDQPLLWSSDLLTDARRTALIDIVVKMLPLALGFMLYAFWLVNLGVALFLANAFSPAGQRTVNLHTMHGFSLSRVALLAFMVGMGAAFTDGYLSFAGLVLLGALGALFSWLGFGLVYDALRPLPQAWVWRLMLYASVLFFGQVSMPILAILAMLDCGFRWRARREEIKN
jgi:hypothetical protein